MTKNHRKMPTKSNAIKATSKRGEVKSKILRYLREVLHNGGEIEDVSKQDIAEACNYSAPRSHGFFYAWRELVNEGKVENSDKNGYGRLTRLGKESCLPPMNNAEKKAFLLQHLQGKRKGPADKIAIIVDILDDGKPHHLTELCEATGWNRTVSWIHLELKEKGLAECDDKTYTLTDEWFPDGRPSVWL